MHGAGRPVGTSGPQVLARHRGGGAHQPDRRPGDEREQLRIRDGVGGLGGGAGRQRADERQQQHAPHVHRDSLDAGRQPEPEQLADDPPVRAPRPAAREADHPPACPQPVQRVDRHDAGGDHGPHRRARRAERRDRPETRDQDHVQRDVQHRDDEAEPQRRFRVAGGAQSTAEHEEHQRAGAEHEHDAQVGKRLGLHGGGGVDEVEQRGREHVAERRHHAERQADRREKRLVDRAVDLVGLVASREPCDQHAHAGKQRRDEHDDHEEDLPAHPDRGVRREPDVVADHDVVDEALQAADDVLEHRGPRQLPYGRKQRAFDQGAVVVATRGADGSRLARPLHQLTLPSCEVSMSADSPPSNRKASRFLYRNSRAFRSRTFSP